MILNLQIIVLKSKELLWDWKIDNIQRNYRLVKRMQSINDGKMNKIKFYQFVKAWIKQTRHKIESQSVATNTDSKENFSADYDP